MTMSEELRNRSPASPTSTDSSGVFVKLVLREEIRKLKITEFSSPYEEMIKFVDEQFSVLGVVRLSYKDDDGDEITVSSNREVQDALQSSGNVKILKFNVKDMKEESGSDNSEPNSPSGNIKENLQTSLYNTVVSTPSHVLNAMLEETQMSQLQSEVDQRVTGLRRGKSMGDEKITVPNIFTTFDNKVMRQFEVGTNGVSCTICPLPKCPKPTTDFSNLRAHGRSETHQQQLTYHITGEHDLNNSNILSRTLEYPLSWRLNDRATAAQLIAAKYHHFGAPTGQRRKRTAFSPATTLALEQFANSINWKRGESEKINEFAQKHNLTFYQVKVWMNNHRPRKNNMNYVPHPYLKDNKHFLPSRDLSKVIQALGDTRTDAFSFQNLASSGLQYNLPIHSSALTSALPPLTSEQQEQVHSSAFTSVSNVGSPDQGRTVSTTPTDKVAPADIVSKCDPLSSSISSTSSSDLSKFSNTLSTSSFEKFPMGNFPLSSQFPAITTTCSPFSGELIFSNGLLGSDNRDISQLFSSVKNSNVNDSAR
ncbi:uncharacterized protein LOC134822782 [Bolinopsis microptera]|uniref:uncharacterized protein LOC134822782 n=1 Tax=Bolinopsis microptera TaxID=2820187 RepID=UPI003079DE86